MQAAPAGVRMPQAARRSHCRGSGPAPCRPRPGWGRGDLVHRDPREGGGQVAACLVGHLLSPGTQEADGEVHHVGVGVEGPAGIVDAVLARRAQQRKAEAIALAQAGGSVLPQGLARLGCGTEEDLLPLELLGAQVSPMMADQSLSPQLKVARPSETLSTS